MIDQQRRIIPDFNIMKPCNLSASCVDEVDIVSTGAPSRLSATSGKTNGKTKFSRKVGTSGNSYRNQDLPESTASVSSSLIGSKSAEACTRRRLSLKSLSTAIVGLLELRRLTMADPNAVESETIYENTYKMSPDSGQHFAISKIHQIAFNILKTEIGDVKYSSIHAGYQARFVSEKIKSKVKELGIARYRIVCQVLITEGQGIRTASRCLWEPTIDNFTTATYKNETTCATAMIFGIYFD